MPSKISFVIEAGRKLEGQKIGFTVPDLMNELKWKETERFYLQNAMAQLTRKGKARKLGSKKPIVYSFKSLDVMNKEKSSARNTPGASSKAKLPLLTNDNPSKLSYEDIAQMQISPELIGRGVIHLNEQLKLKSQELESALKEIKRQLADSLERIRQQNATIEEQSRTIANLKRDYKLAARLRTPIIQRKKAG